MKSEPDIIEVAQLMAELSQSREQLTRVQNECTKLLLEKRELEAKFEALKIENDDLLLGSAVDVDLNDQLNAGVKDMRGIIVEVATYLGLKFDPFPTRTQLMDRATELQKAEQDLADLETTFDLQWKADMDAVAIWRKEDPEGRALKLPDRRNQFVWLCRKVVELQTFLGRQETQLSISEWANSTFGPSGSTLRVAARANEEMAELLRWLSMDDAHPKALEEIADVVIILYRAAWRLGGDLHAEIDRKMAINRAREWNLDGSGHGYHVKGKAGGQ